MRRPWAIAARVVAIAVGLAIVASLLRPGGPTRILPAERVMYPKASKMPPAVPETMGQLLARFETILRERGPAALAVLRPGLSDEEIDAIESRHQFRLPPDLRALYRWRNGAPTHLSVPVAFADHEFVPLDEAVSRRELLRRQVAERPPAQREAYATYCGHRDPWLDVVVDLGGDGFFFDPTRSEAEGSFFFCFNETGNYVFFPAFRNFLAATIEGHGAGIYEFSDLGCETTDHARAAAILQRYGAAPAP